MERHRQKRLNLLIDTLDSGGGEEYSGDDNENNENNDGENGPASPMHDHTVAVGVTPAVEGGVVVSTHPPLPLKPSDTSVDASGGSSATSATNPGQGKGGGAHLPERTNEQVLWW